MSKVVEEFLVWVGLAAIGYVAGRLALGPVLCLILDKLRGL